MGSSLDDGKGAIGQVGAQGDIAGVRKYRGDQI